MERFEINKVIFLNHRQLINILYGEDAEKCCYGLREELFYFDKRPEEEQKHEGEEKKCRLKKRKRVSDVEQNENASESTKDLEEFSKKLNEVLDRLKTKHFNSPHRVSSTLPLPRYWEQVDSNFPQFNGCNMTNVFQQFAHQNQIYLIPPKCRFYNYDVREMSKLLPELPQYDLIVLDPPWQNKYVRRLKRTRQNLAYDMLANLELKKIPISTVIHNDTICIIWCTNSRQHQAALLDDILPAWNLRLFHRLKWFKMNTSCELIVPLKLTSSCNKQPFENAMIAIHRDRNIDDLDMQINELKKFETLLSIPSIIHSHKPPLLPWLKDFLPSQPKCLEIFARYLQPNFTCIGLEVLKLMDKRLYTARNNE